MLKLPPTEDLKRWHWIVLGTLVGVALGYVWTGTEPGAMRNAGAEQFVRFLTQTDPQTQQPIIRDITVHPPQTDFQGNPVHRVTFRKLMRVRDGDARALVAEQFYAPVPFVPPGQRGDGIDPNYTVARYLDELKERNPEISYRQGWWSDTPAGYAMWTIGAIVAVGIFWPTVLNGLIGAGYGRPRKQKKKEDYFARFSSQAEPARDQAAKPRLTQAEQDRLVAMTQQLEGELKGIGVSVAGASDAQAPAAAVRKLEGGPLEAAAPVTQPDDDEIEIKGEYYPVLIHHKKTSEKEK